MFIILIISYLVITFNLNLVNNFLKGNISFINIDFKDILSILWTSIVNITLLTVFVLSSISSNTFLVCLFTFSNDSSNDCLYLKLPLLYPIHFRVTKYFFVWINFLFWILSYSKIGRNSPSISLYLFESSDNSIFTLSQ